MLLSHRTVLSGTIVPLLAMLLLSGCASLPAIGGREPRVIVIRNLSGADIDTVSLREVVTGPRPASFGSLSPVPQGMSQEYRRPAHPPLFPRTVVVEWVDSEGKTHMRELSISKALRRSTGDVDEALVFEIGPFEEVLVFIEKDRK